MEMDRYIGRLLDGRYEILEVIGVGGMAVVYKARCHRLNRLVAIKILKDDFSQDDEFRRRFHAESQAVAMLSHPNIVSVYDVSTADSADYIVMELIDGITLKQYMEKKGVLNWKETLHFAIQIGKALDHAHSRGIVHRDIKPHNVMVLKNGSVKVADFGIAQVMSKSTTLTKEALGSVHYISPEQARGGRVDNRSDIYSLGVVMYEMMTGRPPYDGDSPVAVAIQHINGNAPMPSTINPNIPGGLEQIIMKAMSQSPAQRYSTEAAMLRDMDEFRKNPGILFDYHNPHTDMDAAVRLSENRQKREAPVVPPKTAAEKAVEKKEPPKPRQTPPQRKKKKPARHREEVILEEEERTGKTTMIAMIACGLVAVLAIGIFVAVVAGGGLGDRNEMVVVPDLIGKTQEELNYSDVVIRLGDKAHSADYEEGRIYDQNPKGGTNIAKGGIVTIYVSLGPAPEAKRMENLNGLTEEAAKTYLMDTLEIEKDKIVVHREASASVEEGQVTRTKPTEDEELTADQIVEIWISTGPETREVQMPRLVGQTRDNAKALLNNNGFQDLEFVEVQSNQAKGIVVYQSEEAQTMVDITKKIILHVSIGPNHGGEENPEPEIPTPDPDLKSKVVTIKLSEDYVENYTLSIWQGNQMVDERLITVGTLDAQFSLTGKGTMTFTLKINSSNENSWDIEVNFDEE